MPASPPQTRQARPGRTAIRALLAALALAVTSPLAAQTVVFERVHVVDPDAGLVRLNHSVLVEDGRIVALADAEQLEIPADATRIDGRDRFLMPGLYEMHAHVPRNDADTARVMTLFLVNGVTTVRGMLGAPEHLALRADIAAGTMLGPRLITSGPSFNGNSVSSPQQATAMVEQQHADGYDFLKLHPGLERAEFDAIVDAARRLGMPFAGHVSADVGLARALEAGQDSIDHLDGYLQALIPDDADRGGRDGGFFAVGLADLADAAQLDALAGRTAAAGVWNVPTQTLLENLILHADGDALAARPEMRYMPAATVQQWRAAHQRFVTAPDYDAAVARRAIQLRRDLIRALHAAGAGLLLGADAPQVFNVPGFALHRELELMVASGLTPAQALAMGTSNPARYFGEEQTRGAVAVGNVADLVLLDANPLANIRNTQNIVGVMHAGRWLSQADLATLKQRYVTTE